MALLVLTSLATLTASFVRTTRDHLEVASDANHALRADLACESALQHTIRRISDDPDWFGTEGRELAIESDSGFTVERLDDGLDRRNITVLLSGMSGGSTVKREARLEYKRGGLGVWAGKGLVTMGGDLDINNVEFHSDVLWVDTTDGVLDYDPLTGEWIEPSVSLEFGVKDNNWTIEDGQFYSYGDEGGSDYLNENRTLLSRPVQVPVWNLEEYLIPGPDRLITTDTTFNNFHTDKTLVIVPEPGEEIVFNNAVAEGGIVIYTPPNYDPREPATNTFSVNNFVVGGGEKGIHPKIGIIAPRAACTHFNNDHPDTNGLVFVHSMPAKINNTEVTGPIHVVNGDVALNNFTSYMPEDFWEGFLEYPIPGLDGGRSRGEALVKLVRESYVGYKGVHGQGSGESEPQLGQ